MKGKQPIESLLVDLPQGIKVVRRLSQEALAQPLHAAVARIEPNIGEPEWFIREGN
jgi:hypothetical protein